MHLKSAYLKWQQNCTPIFYMPNVTASQLKMYPHLFNLGVCKMEINKMLFFLFASWWCFFKQCWCDLSFLSLCRLKHSKKPNYLARSRGLVINADGEWPRGTVYWMDISDASYYVINKMEIKVAKCGTPKKRNLTMIGHFVK